MSDSDSVDKPTLLAVAIVIFGFGMVAGAWVVDSGISTQELNRRNVERSIDDCREHGGVPILDALMTLARTLLGRAGIVGTVVAQSRGPRRRIRGDTCEADRRMQKQTRTKRHERAECSPHFRFLQNVVTTLARCTG